MQHTSNLSSKTILVIQALKYYGKKNIDNKILETISKNLTETETYIMLKEAKHSTKWVYEIIQKIAKEKKLNTENWQINNK